MIRSRPFLSAFTLLEVIVSMCLVAAGLASIVAVYARTAQTLRATRQTAAASQILQQRIEIIRMAPWPYCSTSAGLARLLSRATESESETIGTTTETVTVYPVVPSADGPMEGPKSISAVRQAGTSRVQRAGDLATESELIVVTSLEWGGTAQPQQRTLRSVICRAGLTRTGLFGSALGKVDDDQQQ